MFKDRRIREAIGLAFDFEWTNQNIMFGLYRRTTLLLRELGHEGRGPARRRRSCALLEPFRGKVPDEVFGEPYVPPVSDGSGSDRNLLRRADALLREAGCKREGSVLKLPDGKPFEIEFLDFQAIAAAAHAAVSGQSEAARHRGALAHRRRGAVPPPHGRFRLRHGQPRRSAAR